MAAFYYDLDNDSSLSSFVGLSSSTVGAHWFGRAETGDIDFVYRAEFAKQQDTGGNPFDIDAEYLNLEAGAAWDNFQVVLGSETLGGSGNPGDKFSTPLATLHAFNGFADLFLNTPDDGLQDTYLRVSGTVQGTKFTATYHDFSADTGSRDYGNEFDLTASHKLDWGGTVGFRFADFTSDDAAFADTTKAWLWIAFGF